MSFARLPNGLRLVVLQEPSLKEMSFQMLIDVGSLDETDGQLGYAHLIEHLSFRGTDRAGDDVMRSELERQGLRYGADLRASTNYDRTLYSFDFPSAGATELTLGVRLMAGVATGLAIRPESFAAEKRVVLAEIDRTNDARRLKDDARFGFLMQNRWAAARNPLGTSASIQQATMDGAKRFFDDNYRPHRVTLVVVGPIAASQVRAAVEKEFSEWMPSGSAAGVASARRAGADKLVEIMSGRGTPEEVALAWVRDADQGPDTSDRRLTDLRRELAALVLQRRLTNLSLRPDGGLLSASVGLGNVERVANIIQLVGVPRPGRLEQALKGLIRAHREASGGTITDAEFQEAVDEVRAELRNRASEVETAGLLSQRIVEALRVGEVPVRGAELLTEYNRLLDRTTKEHVDEAMNDLFRGTGPLLFVSGDHPGGREKWQTELRAGYDAPFSISTVQAPERLVRRSLTPTGASYDTSALDELGATQFVFGNGTRLLFKRTSLEPHRVNVAVAFGGGLLSLPPLMGGANWLIGDRDAYVLGGTGNRSPTEISRTITSAGLSVGYMQTPNAYVLGGQVASDAFAQQVGLLFDLTVNPAFGVDARVNARDRVAGLIEPANRNPMSVLIQESGPILHGHDPRWTALRSRAQIYRTDLGSVVGVLRKEAQGPKTIVVVGDVEPADVIAAIRDTFGVLPAAVTPQTRSSDGRVRMATPVPKPHVFRHAGNPELAAIGQYWPVPGYDDDRKLAASLTVLAEVMRLRLIAQARNSAGLTYAPSTLAAVSRSIPGYGFFAVTAEVAASEIGRWTEIVDGIVGSIASTVPGADELSRAKRPLVEGRKRDLGRNAFWVTALLEVSRSRDRAKSVERDSEWLNEVTSEDLKIAARRFLGTEHRTTIQVLPNTENPLGHGAVLPAQRRR